MEIQNEMRILLIDDEEDAAEVSAADLRDYGLNVRILTDSTKSIPVLKEYRPHLVVLDLEMPGKNGIEVLFDMHGDPDLREIPVVGNSIHMDAKDNMGVQFYQTFLHLKQKEPNFVYKLSPDESISNNLTAVVGIELVKKYKIIPRALAIYLDSLSLDSYKSAP